MVIELKHVKKIYENNNIEVVKDFNLKIEDQEFIVFVGPSGCGKSTTLRMIAGLEKITAGTISFDGKVINDLLPGERNIGMVFQSYALYPNMSIYKNMEFPLKIAKVAPEERDRRIKSAAEMLGLTEFLDRKPKNLSGGQRQRVAVGREIVRDVDIFLMDEPLSNLDAKLRVQMRSEITSLHRRLKKTFIYVTHDQVEAMTMATRIVIMNGGIVQQIGTPKEVFEYPENIFVAGFIGTPGMNFINGIVGEDGYFRVGDFKIEVPKAKFAQLKEQNYIGKEIVLGIRPENINVEDLSNAATTAEIQIDNAELLGYDYNLLFTIGANQLVSRIKAVNVLHPGDKVKLNFEMEKAHFFDKDTTVRIK